MNLIKTKQKGFTIIELVLVLTIIVVLIGLSVGYYMNSQIRMDVNSEASNVVHYLRLTQSNAASGLNNSKHGIHFESGYYVIFKGNSYDPNSTANFRINLPSTMIINNMALNGGGHDVIFSKTDGTTTNYGSISVYSAKINKAVQITISQIGTINY